jgi:DNA repair protein RecO (recombination protein O)
MSLQKTSALVIKSIDWRDSSKITTLFTRELGKVNVIAKGAKRAKSPYQGLLESMNLIDAVIYSSPRRELQNLGEVSLESSFNAIRKSLQKTGYALSILELLECYFRHSNPDGVFFDFSKQIFFTLDGYDNEQVIFCYFLLKLASYLGFKPEFLICRCCGQQVESREATFSLAEGSVVCDRCRHVSDPVLTLAREDLQMLAAMQQAHYKKLGTFRFLLSRSLNLTDVLLHYIQFHTGQIPELSGLKLLKHV